MEGDCYLCGKRTVLTLEHIIPQCLGGVLSEYLYCTKCNSKCGHDIDVELARQFGRYATILQISRERGVNQPFIVMTDNGDLKLKCDGKNLVRSKPIVRIEKDENGGAKEVEIVARSEEEVREIFSNIANAYNIGKDIEIIEQVEFSPPDGFYEFVLDNSLIHRAIAKIAYSFACMRLPNNIVQSDAFNSIRGFILGETKNSLAHSNFIDGGFMVDNRRPLHKIHLAFIRNERLLIGYVALFGMFRYTTVLSDSLTSEVAWAGMDYTYNPVIQRDVPGNENFVAPTITRDNVLRPRQSKEQILRALQRGQEIIAEHSPILESGSVEAIPESSKGHNK